MLVKKILVVDDEKNITFVVKALLEKAGFSVTALNSAQEALSVLQKSEHDYSAVITDLYMPELNGLELLKQIKLTNPDLPVIMITAYGSVENAVDALKQGAFDFITKPFDQGELVNVTEKAVKTYFLRTKEPLVFRVSESFLEQSLIIGKSSKIQDLQKMIRKIAPSPSTVLISGELGTGKDIVAHEIHRLSDRVEKPFIKLNCYSVPLNLLEAELFGVESELKKPGKLELAHEGTLYLDEISILPLETQVKLCRFLQTKEFERVGGINTLKVNVRVIASTDKDLSQAVREGKFREDLFYALNVVPLYVPSLRERKLDLEDLVYFFVKKANEKLSKNIQSIESNFMEKILKYDWPGNISELENVIERAVLLSDGEILYSHVLPLEILNFKASNQADTTKVMSEDQILDEFKKGKPLKDIVKKKTMEIERKIIEEALMQNNFNITKTSQKLGLSRKGLQLKIKELGIQLSFDIKNE